MATVRSAARFALACGEPAKCDVCEARSPLNSQLLPKLNLNEIAEYD